MKNPGPRLRESAPLRPACAAVLFLAAAVVAPGSAFAQRLANQFNDGAANATQAPTAAGQFGPQGASSMNFMPHVPKAVSRPEGWPTSKENRTKKSVDNHVLSSIRANPGAPLEPITSADGSPDGGVVLANFEEAAPGAPPPSAADTVPPQAQSLETALVIARVGPEVVLEGDLLTPSALAWLAKVSPGLKPEQIRELKLQICRQVLPQHVESLIVYVDACRTIPEDRLPEIEKKVNEAFDQQQLPRLIKDAGVANSLEYEQLLRSRGQSLDRIRKMFFERALAQQWIQQKVTKDEEIPHAEMIAWYQNHLAEYDYPAKAKFEQFTVRIGPTQSRDQAWNKLAAMGNDVLEGKPFADIARTRSEGPTAASGGGYDWTTKGSLASKLLDEAVFTLPVGQLSAIIEDGGALHIVRVTERTEAGRTPFIEAQVGIKETLQQERRKREMDEYLARLKERTPVWTVFDDKPAAATAAARREGISR